MEDAVDLAESRILGLPAELRNEIYEYVVLDTNIIKFDRNQNIIPAPHSLALTCRQVRREFESVQHATTYDHHTMMRIFVDFENFAFASASKLSFWDLDLDKSKTKVTACIRLTNTFEATMPQLRATKGFFFKRFGEFRVTWDARSFDVDFAESYFARYRIDPPGMLEEIANRRILEDAVKSSLREAQVAASGTRVRKPKRVRYGKSKVRKASRSALA